MQSVASVRLSRRNGILASFTLVEMLTVIAIIAILAGLTLAAATAVMGKANRSRASVEISAMSSALENYKSDNGAYPAASLLTTNTYTTSDNSAAGGLYQQSSEVLFLSLSGKTNFTDAPVGGVKVYMNFKQNQVGTAPGGSYVQDPWSYSYGYSTGTTTTPPNNGSGFFDLWSTGGAISTANGSTNSWQQNW